ncbi:SoxR reducing system RseC family protein [Methyloversatilis sp.]|uniref:SoxR reducing system RseC family protein n=1 Tax=Methyloversatilis sp. TaxID=2569862 RepID=UPI002735E7D3|nr:SoxR reducing system RseC family protein [Methyloversatilis sp.]MDP2869273.1 SoxR reducing system RseC family protein [Methyloversatilis sp.]MDP3288825.1 SoxR reducing system RseC family protein [Methyloversatilis sp.]MDP3454872.1 SoxR reducing system RseC family protein [Methyloversatilis sp.]MDP3577990.1 SoxR reducing system RseC family protein [Methyloversatilis sp.]
MDIRQGQVRRVAGRLAWVDVVRSSGCGRCADVGGCGQACSARPTTFVIPISHAVAEGDRVQVSVPQRAPLIAALMTYGVGLATMFAGALLARFAVGGSDLVVAAGAVTGLAASVLWLRHMQPRAELLPVIHAVAQTRTLPES